MDNCYQYLLSVAQKIINEYADKKTIDKYFNLKQRLIGKYNFQTENSHLALSTFNKESSKCATLKASIVESEKKKKSKCKTRQSISRSKTIEDQHPSRARVQSYSSKVTDRSNCIERVQQEGYYALLHAATLIKNAELCPNILKTITFYPNSFSLKINNILEVFAASLATIFKILIEKEDSVEKSRQKQNVPQKEQIIKDNRWLMEKLENFLDQNTTLRRMIGHRVY